MDLYWPSSTATKVHSVIYVALLEARTCLGFCMVQPGGLHSEHPRCFPFVPQTPPSVLASITVTKYPKQLTYREERGVEETAQHLAMCIAFRRGAEFSFY